MHPLFEYDLNGKNYDQNMTDLDPKLRLNYHWYVKIKIVYGCTNNTLDRKTKLK